MSMSKNIEVSFFELLGIGRLLGRRPIREAGRTFPRLRSPVLAASCGVTPACSVLRAIAPAWYAGRVAPHGDLDRA